MFLASVIPIEVLLSTRNFTPSDSMCSMCGPCPSRVAVCFVFVPAIPTSLVFRRFQDPIELYTLLRSQQQKTDHLYCLNRRQLRRIQV